MRRTKATFGGEDTRTVSSSWNLPEKIREERVRILKNLHTSVGAPFSVSKRVRHHNFLRHFVCPGRRTEFSLKKKKTEGNVPIIRNVQLTVHPTEFPFRLNSRPTLMDHEASHISSQDFTYGLSAILL